MYIKYILCFIFYFRRKWECKIQVGKTYCEFHDAEKTEHSWKESTLKYFKFCPQKIL